MNRKQEMFIMNQAGFSLLVLGYMGEKAGEFKEKFIIAFNSIKLALNAMSLANLIKLQNLEMAIEPGKN